MSLISLARGLILLRIRGLAGLSSFRMRMRGMFIGGLRWLRRMGEGIRRGAVRWGPCLVSGRNARSVYSIMALPIKTSRDK